MSKTDIAATIGGCSSCRPALAHIEALRSLVRPARRAGEAMQGVLGAYLMQGTDAESAQDLMALCLEIETIIAKIVRTANTE